MKLRIHSPIQRLRRWGLGIGEYLHPTLYNERNYLSMWGLKLMHVSKRDPGKCSRPTICRHVVDTTIHSILYPFTHVYLDIDINMTDATIWSFDISTIYWTHLVIFLRQYQPWIMFYEKLQFRDCSTTDDFHALDVLMVICRAMWTSSSKQLFRVFRYYFHYFVFFLYHRTIAAQLNVSQHSSSNHWPKTL